MNQNIFILIFNIVVILAFIPHRQINKKILINKYHTTLNKTHSTSLNSISNEG